MVEADNKLENMVAMAEKDTSFFQLLFVFFMYKINSEALITLYIEGSV